MAYEGDMLLQAVHDDVEITLLKDVIQDSSVDPSPRRKVTVRLRSLVVDTRVTCALSEWLTVRGGERTNRWERDRRRASRC